jgi:hypothetical protein
MSYKRVKLKELKQSHCVDYSKNRKELGDNFILEGYIPKKGIISIGSDYKIINGNHRYCLLLKKYGEDHKIIVCKRFVTYGVINTITTSISILLLPLVIPYLAIKNYKKRNKKI